MGKRARSGSMSGSASAKKRFRRGRYPYARRYRPTYVRPGYGAIGRTPGGAVLGETKYFDTAVSQQVVQNNNAAWTNTTIDPTTFNTLCVPVVGAAFNQRIGKEINIVKMKIRGSFILPAQEEDSNSVPAMVIRYGCFKTCKLMEPKLGAVSNDTNNNSSTSTAYIQNIDNFGRFKVLKDKTAIIQDPNIGGAANSHDSNGKVVNFKFTIKFRKPIQVRFNQTNGGTVADIIDNSLHFFANSSNGRTSGMLPVYVTYLSRVCYKE